VTVVVNFYQGTRCITKCKHKGGFMVLTGFFYCVEKYLG
jgi:hypothetical protein